MPSGIRHVRGDALVHLALSPLQNMDTLPRIRICRGNVPLEVSSTSGQSSVATSPVHHCTVSFSIRTLDRHPGRLSPMVLSAKLLLEIQNTLDLNGLY